MSWNLIKYAMESVIVDYFIQHIDLAIFTLFTLAEMESPPPPPTSSTKITNAFNRLQVG